MASRQVTTTEFVTVKQAKEWLAENNTQNRPHREWWSDMLAEEIRNGTFQTTHQGIAFNGDGTLIDGQHRLYAIVKAGKGVSLQVTRGMRREAMYGIDQGRLRTPTDVGQFVGVQVEKRQVATAKAMHDAAFTLGQRIKTRYTSRWVLAYFAKHREAIDFAHEHLFRDPFRHAVIRGLVARAWYTADRDRLIEFCHALQEGTVARKADAAAGALYRYFVPHSKQFSNGPMRGELYAKAQYALQKFLARESVATLRDTKGQAFPIPGDEEA